MAMLTSEHAGTARSTDGICYETVGKSYTFVTDSVDVRCMDIALVISADTFNFKI